MMPLERHERNYRIRDLAAYFRVTRTTIYRWIALGELPPPVKIIGATRFWTHASLQEFMKTEKFKETK